MPKSSTFKDLLLQLESGQRGGACVSPREILKELLAVLYTDAVATEQANAKPSGKSK